MSKFFVIDELDNTSYSEKHDASESFTSEAAAIKRAKIVAASMPGEHIIIAKAIKTVICRVGAPETRDEK